MKKKLLALSVTLAFVGASPVTWSEGDIKAGKDKASACTGCHGEKGNSLVPMYPKLAQQHASYLVKQLTAFKEGSRENAMMNALAMSLSEKDIEDLAAFYSSQKISRNSPPVLENEEDDEEEDSEDTSNSSNQDQKLKDLMALGSDLYRNGDLVREVSACIACHGPYGEGNEPAAFPALNSQHAEYLIKALSDFKGGARSNNPDNMMHMIAKKMTEEEIRAVSYHISVMK